MQPRVIAIVGATATGKTALGIDLAQRLGGEILNADSRQVYCGMDIGTAKPTPAERSLVPHHLIDILDPDANMTLATFLDRANVALSDILARGRMPIVVGGTGQYIWALLEGWRVPRVPPNHELRRKLEDVVATNGPAALVAELQRVDPPSAASIDVRNTRRVIRAIEVTLETGRPFSEWQQRDPPAFTSKILGLHLERRALYKRIDRRVDHMMQAGFLDEVLRLTGRGYSCSLPSMSGIGYRQLCEHLAGSMTLAQAVARIKTETHRLARMQHTWFKPGDSRIHWLDADSPALPDQAQSVLSASNGVALS